MENTPDVVMCPLVIMMVVGKCLLCLQMMLSAAAITTTMLHNQLCKAAARTT